MKEAVWGRVEELEKYQLGTVGSVHWLSGKDSEGRALPFPPAQMCHGVSMIGKPLHTLLFLPQHLAFPKAWFLWRLRKKPVMEDAKEMLGSSFFKAFLPSLQVQVKRKEHP